MNKYLAGACIVLILVLVLIGCHKCSGPKVETTVVHDTTYVHDRDSNDYTPQIVAVMGGQIPPEVKTIYKERIIVDTTHGTVDTLYVYEREAVDSLLSSYYATNYYSDTQSTKYGNVVIQDSVTENKIKRRRLITDFTIPIASTSETKLITEPKKVKGFFTLSVQGSRLTLLQAVGVGGMLQFKNDNVLGVSLMVNREVPVPNWPTTPFNIMYGQKISFHH